MESGPTIPTTPRRGMSIEPQMAEEIPHFTHRDEARHQEIIERLDKLAQIMDAIRKNLTKDE